MGFFHDMGPLKKEKFSVWKTLKYDQFVQKLLIILSLFTYILTKQPHRFPFPNNSPVCCTAEDE